MIWRIVMPATVLAASPSSYEEGGQRYLPWLIATAVVGWLTVVGALVVWF
ncbi:MAG TPA: hypothetical protein VGI83_06490 [Gemmatimonadales bacterium]